MEENMLSMGNIFGEFLYLFYWYWVYGNLGMVIIGNVMVDKGVMIGLGGVVLEKDIDIVLF